MHTFPFLRTVQTPASLLCPASRTCPDFFTCTRPRGQPARSASVLMGGNGLGPAQTATGGRQHSCISRNPAARPGGCVDHREHARAASVARRYGAPYAATKSLDTASPRRRLPCAAALPAPKSAGAGESAGQPSRSSLRKLSPVPSGKDCGAAPSAPPPLARRHMPRMLHLGAHSRLLPPLPAAPPRRQALQRACRRKQTEGRPPPASASRLRQLLARRRRPALLRRRRCRRRGRRQRGLGG